MVFISKQAQADLENIVVGLLGWSKVELTVDEVMQYVDDIVGICYQLGSAAYRRKATYTEHVKHGAYAYLYKRSRQTVWYIIYSVDGRGDILVNKIISNHTTVS